MGDRGQLGFAETFVSAGLGRNRKLERLDGLIDWVPVGRLAADEREARNRSGTGRPPYDPLSMLKALYLQALYDLSDPGLEEALQDRLSFRRFCGFALDAPTPDDTTIWRFREQAGPLLEAAFEEIGRQLDAEGLVVRRGTLMDATLVASARRPPRRSAGAGAGHPEEPDADWTKQNGKAFFGYKAHVGDERAVYGDRAYEHKERRARLKAAGIKDRIMHRRHKHMAALPYWPQRRNRLISRRRAPVEAVFSALKRLYGQSRAKSLTLERNTARLMAAVTAYNLRRASLLAGP